MAIISDWIITHDGVTYPAGEVITDLPKKLAEKYVAEGIAKRVPVVNNAEGSFISNTNGGNLPPPAGGAATNTGDDNKTDDDEALTPEEFGKLGAAEQKKELEEIGLVPDSNAAARLAQYTAWYESADDDLDDEEDEAI